MNWQDRCEKAGALVKAYLSQVESYRRELSLANAELASRPSEIFELESEVASLRLQLSVLQKRYESQQEVVLLGEQYIAGLKLKAAGNEAELAAQAQRLAALEGHAARVVHNYDSKLSSLRAQLISAQEELKRSAKWRSGGEPTEVPTPSTRTERGKAQSSGSMHMEDTEEERTVPNGGSTATKKLLNGVATASMAQQLLNDESPDGSHRTTSHDNHRDLRTNTPPRQEGPGKSRSGTLKRSKSSKFSNGPSLVSTSTGFFSSVRQALSPSSHGPAARLANDHHSSPLSPGLAPRSSSVDRGFRRSSSLVSKKLPSSPLAAPAAIVWSPRSLSFGAYPVESDSTPVVSCFVSLSGHSAWVMALCLAPDGTLWSGSADRSIRGWRDGACIATMAGASKYHYRSRATDGHKEAIYALVLAADGILWSASADKSIKGWQNGACVATLSGHLGPVAALAAARDGTLFSGSHDKTVRAWRGGACTATMRAHTDAVTCLALGPDEESLWSGSSDGTIRRWRRGACATTLSGHRGEVLALAVWPDGTLWSGGTDNAVKGWRGGQCVATLVGHLDRVLCLAVGPGGGDVWSGSKDGTVRKWQLASTAGGGVCVAVYEGHCGRVETLAAAPDGTVWSGSWDKTIKGWR